MGYRRYFFWYIFKNYILGEWNNDQIEGLGILFFVGGGHVYGTFK